MLFKFLYYK